MRYAVEWSGDAGAVLEFEAALDDRVVHHVDILRVVDSWLRSFPVMVRCVQALPVLIAHVARALGGSLAAASDGPTASSRLAYA